MKCPRLSVLILCAALTPATVRVTSGSTGDADAPGGAKAGAGNLAAARVRARDKLKFTFDIVARQV